MTSTSICMYSTHIKQLELARLILQACVGYWEPPHHKHSHYTGNNRTTNSKSLLIHKILHKNYAECSSTTLSACDYGDKNRSLQTFRILMTGWVYGHSVYCCQVEFTDIQYSDDLQTFRIVYWCQVERPVLIPQSKYIFEYSNYLPQDITVYTRMWM